MSDREYSSRNSTSATIPYPQLAITAPVQTDKFKRHSDQRAQSQQRLV